MKIFEIEFTDTGPYSWEKYYVMAETEEDALAYFGEEHQAVDISRPYKVHKYGEGEVIIDIY